MPKLAHSAKGLETLRLIDCDTTGWVIPDIKWEPRTLMLPTEVQCPTCYGRGRVADAEIRAAAAKRIEAGERVTHDEKFAEKRCPTCPMKRSYRSYGTGTVTELRPQKVMVGIIQWPKGTLFASRFRYGNSINQCELCGKAHIVHWTPVLGKDRSGKWIGLWLGEDCARTILGVSNKEIHFSKATLDAADKKAELQAWKAMPKPPKPVKPPKPALPADIPKQYQYEEIAKEAFGELRTSRLENTRAISTYRFSVTLPGGTGTGFDVVLDVRHGVRIKDDWQDKPIVKEKTQDILKVFRDSIPKLKERVQYAAQKRKEQGWG